MTEPVRLSRERWDALSAAIDVRPSTDYFKKIWINGTVESRGVIFLPAEYVPDERHYDIFHYDPKLGATIACA